MATTEEQSSRPSSRLETLKRRADFLRVRNGSRFATQGFVLEGKERAGQDERARLSGARFGFTVGKRLGTAVERNRIRRRLKSAVRDVVRSHSRGDFDYILIARRGALDLGFAALVSDLIVALGRVHAKSGGSQRPRASRPKARTS